MFSRIKRWKRLAFHDNLTGLFNRNWLKEYGHKINKKYIYFIDINDLHIINKKGHHFGDKHIVDIAENIKLKTESNEFVRYGGDEFLLFANPPDLLETNELYSVGCAEHFGNIKETIIRSDKNMIENKRKFKKR